MSTGDVRSTRRKTMPLSAGACRSVMRTFWPVWSPTPEALTRDFRVRWRNMRAADCNGTDKQEGLVGLLAQKSRDVVLVDARLLQRFDRRSAVAADDRRHLVQPIVVHRAADRHVVSSGLLRVHELGLGLARGRSQSEAGGNHRDAPGVGQSMARTPPVSRRGGHPGK